MSEKKNTERRGSESTFAMAIHKIMEDNDSYVSEYYEEPANSGNGEGRKTWLAIPFCRYMES